MVAQLIGGAAIAAVMLSSPAAYAQQSISVLTGGTSGVYYSLGVAIGKIYSDRIPDAKTQVRATETSVENLVLLQQGRGEIAFTPGDSLRAAWDGDEEAGFNSKLDRLRVIGAIYPNYIQIVATVESGIKTLADLKGKSLSLDARNSAAELSLRAILRASGMDFKDLAKVEYLPFEKTVEMMRSRRHDATLQSDGLGAGLLQDFSNSSDLTVVGVPKAIVDTIGPPFFLATIPANTFRGQNKEVSTAAVVNYLVTSSAVSDDLAYRMTKLVFDALPELADAHPAAGGIKLEAAASSGPVPLHPGAIRYFRENGAIK